ncbi:MAG: TetR/AcrR family transcriptional regulator [Stappiaceae bacterium]
MAVVPDKFCVFHRNRRWSFVVNHLCSRKLSRPGIVMDRLKTKLSDRVERNTKKREEKRRQLAVSTANALCTLGYANTSLRDIAELSGNALGTLHYYFEDRVDLITYSVRYHKRTFLDELTAAAVGEGTLPNVIEKLSIGLAHGVTYNAETHKLWFDIRNQAMFDATFEPAITEIEGEIISIFSQIEQRFLGDRRDAALDYTAVDGLFRYIMQSNLPEHRDFDANVQLFKKMLEYLWQE